MARRKAAPRAVASWGDAIERFTEYLIGRERSPHTRANYRESLTEFGGWYQHTYQDPPILAALAPSELREWKKHLRVDRGLEPATVNRRLAALRSLLKWAEHEGVRPEIAPPASVAEVRRPPRWLGKAEQRALLRAAERSGKPRDVHLITLLLQTGLRVEEAAALRRKDLTIKERGGELVVRQGKGRKQRTIPLNPAARAALRALLALAPERAPEVLWGQRGPLSIDGIQQAVASHARASGIEGLSPHVLRHTFGKNLADQKVPIQIIADLMGHESLETTRRYIQPGQQDLAAAVDTLAGGED